MIKKIQISGLLTIILISSVIPTELHSQEIYPKSAILDTSLMELPSINKNDCIVIHTGYIASFDKEKLIPKWVAYHLTPEKLSGSSRRSGSFKKDSSLPYRQASNEDYLKSGYDKGHMAPAADMKWSDEVMSESFFFTNICPQKPKLNRQNWLALEEYVRNLTKKYGDLWVITGSIAGPDSVRTTIGGNGVLVPQRFYKAILVRNKNGYRSSAFVYENTDETQSVTDKVMTVDSLETIISLNLFKNLGEAEEKAESLFLL